MGIHSDSPDYAFGFHNPSYGLHDQHNDFIDSETKELINSVLNIPPNDISTIKNSYMRASHDEFHDTRGLLINIYIAKTLAPYEDVFPVKLYRHNLVDGEYTSGIMPFKGLTAGMSKPKTVKFQDMDWFLANFEKLIEEYKGDWLAIVNNQVVANAATPEGLRQVLKRKAIKRSFIARADPESWGFHK